MQQMPGRDAYLDGLLGIAMRPSAVQAEWREAAAAVAHLNAPRPPPVLRLAPQSSSASRRTAGAVGFLIFSQWLTRPER